MVVENIERKAVMNPDAVEEAQVFSGLVHYYDGQHYEISGSPFVEVGKWTAAGEEQSPEDYGCTYYAALLLGYETNMSWLCAQDGNPSQNERTGQRKYIIHNGFDESGLIIPLSQEEAAKISQQINFVLKQARAIKKQS